MMRLRLNFVIFSLAIAVTALGQWQPVPAFSGARQHAEAVWFQNQVVSIAGSPWANGTSRDGAVFSLASGNTSWTIQRSLDGEGPVVGFGCGIDSQGRIVLFGGRNIDNLDRAGCITYDFAEGPSGNMANRPSNSPDASFVFASDGLSRVYCLGGGNGASATPANPNSTYACRYSASTDSWDSIFPMPSGLANAAATSDGNGHLMVFGGYESAGGARSQNVRLYDVASDSWNDLVVPDMPVALAHHKAILGSDSRIYVIGGESSLGIESRVWVLHVPTLTWSQGQSLSVARKDFGAVKSGDNYIFVLGGTGITGGLATSEKLYTAPNPAFTVQPTSKTLLKHLPIKLSVVVTGGGTLHYEWRKGGSPIADGTTSWGSIVSGSTTNTLMIRNSSENDAGSYDVVVSNVSGSATSSAATIAITPRKSLKGTWTALDLHPAGSVYSQALDVYRGKVVGRIANPDSRYPSRLWLDKAFVWSGRNMAAFSINPPTTVQSTAKRIVGNTIVGNWFKPFQVPLGTTYYIGASVWEGPNYTHYDRYVSGWEYNEIVDTNGSQHVGTASYDDASGNIYSACVVGDTAQFPRRFLQIQGAQTSGSAIDADNVFGSARYPFGVNKMIRWSGPNYTMEDITPAGGAAYVWGSHFGEQAGYMVAQGQTHAMLFATEKGTETDIHPVGVVSSSLSSTRHGIEVGNVAIGSVYHAGVWAGTAASFVDIHKYLPSHFSGSYASGVDVGHDGTIWVAGTAYSSLDARNHAVMWKLDPRSGRR